MKKGIAKKFALGTIFAAAAGYVAGILTAPKSGKETRQDIKDTTERVVAEAEKQLKAAHTELSKLLNEARETTTKFKGTARVELEKAIETGTTAKEKARELLSAAHEGTAQDKDLQRAINEANKSVEYLKKYLKK